MPKDTVPTYGSMHRILRNRRGSASKQLCVDCGRPATDWSYDHQDPDEVRGPTKSGRTDSRPYSLKMSHYQARCKLCHNRLDGTAGGEVGHCISGHRWTAENTYVRPDNGKKQCRECKRERRREDKRRAREFDRSTLYMSVPQSLPPFII